MRIVVVGTGVMGLSAARVLAERGHEVIGLDQFGVGSGLASSSGLTRIWRLAHPDRPRVRLAAWTVELWRRLERDTGRQLLLQSGLLWRGGEAESVASSLAAENVTHEIIDQAAQQRRFPELRWQPGRPVVWQPEAGTVWAAEALAASGELLLRAGGQLLDAVKVTSVENRAGGGVQILTDSRRFEADVAVVTTGPWASTFLAGLGIEIPLAPVLEQVTYVRGGDVPWQERPCVIDVPDDGISFGMYGVPTPGTGYKIGIDEPVRVFDPSSADRSPDLVRQQVVVDRVRADIPGFDASPIRSELCAWTDSPDGKFILDRVGDVVIGCGDSGQGFKFHPMFGEVLADLADGATPHADARCFVLARFD
jgi:sarcosine oxidase